MLNAFIDLGLFTSKVFIIFLFILLLMIAFFLLLARTKDKVRERFIIKNLNQRYDDCASMILAETHNKKEFKKILKQKKAAEKAESAKEKVNVYVLNFHGDIKASAVHNLSEEISALLNVITPKDEVVVRLESAGGVVHGYGLAAAQLMRIRAKNIPLIITIDKIAASGGYLMACVANKIVCAPFAIIGSIGVIFQLPNFHRLLKEKHVDFEQHMAGEFKRTVTIFGENTEEGREKLQQEIEEVHQLFKNVITEHRPQIDIQKVATGEHWLGKQAIDLKLIDEIKTSDDYLLERSKEANLYELTYEIKKPFLSRFSATASKLWLKLLSSLK